MTSLLRKSNVLCNQLLKGCSSKVSVMPQRWLNDMDKSTITVLNQETEAGLLINSYSRAGFRLSNGMMAIGYLFILLSWTRNKFSTFVAGVVFLYTMVIYDSPVEIPVVSAQVPIAIFPKSVLSWNVNTAGDINEESLSLFYTLEPRIDILVIGVGDPGEEVNYKIIQYMKDKKISLEISPTERACATYNFLNAEGRCVAGALIPPTKYRINEDDIVSTKRRNRDLLKVEDYPIV